MQLLSLIILNVFGSVDGDAYLAINEKEPYILFCYLTKDQLKNIIECYNKQTDNLFEIQNSRYLQDIGKTIEDLLSTIYREIKGIPRVIIRNDEPVKLSKLYASIDGINSGQKSYDDPKIQIYLLQDGIWLIRYEYDKRGSYIDLFFKYCDFEV